MGMERKNICTVKSMCYLEIILFSLSQSPVSLFRGYGDNQKKGGLQVDEGFCIKAKKSMR